MFYFIDACKKPSEYYHDIMEWSKNVKIGGYLFGHDICHDNHVEKTVYKCAKELGNKDVWINSKKYAWLIKL